MAAGSLVVFVADLAGYAMAFRTRTDGETASFLDRYYGAAEEVVGGGHGRIVKFMGDAVLAVFPEMQAGAAVAAAVMLQASVVVGRTVNQAFLMGRGPGVRISDAVHAELPAAERSAWRRNEPPVVYVLGEGGETYAGLRKTAAQNAVRW